MRLFFVRHGESEANLLKEFSNQGDEHPLTSRGVTQTENAARTLKDSDITTIYTSPILRARQSGEVFSSVLNAPLVVDEALREYDVGIYEGRSDEKAWLHYGQVFDDWTLHGRWKSRLPEGESFEEIVQRFLPLINDFRASPEDRNYVLMGHSGLFRCMLPFVLQNVDYSWSREAEISNGGQIVADRRGPSFVCSRWERRNVDLTEFLSITQGDASTDSSSRVSG